MTIDDLLDRRYDREHYNCLHFTGEAWERLTGDRRLLDVEEGDFQSYEVRALFKGFRRVEGPTVTPSLILMNNIFGDLHIGICVDRKLLHIDSSGPEFFPLSHYGHRFFHFRYYE